MKKICYRPVYNRKKKLNAQGAALLQVEAHLDKKKIYFSTHIYLTPDQWDYKKGLIINHIHSDSLNYMLREFIINLEQKELEVWKKGEPISLETLKEEFQEQERMSFLNFIKEDISTSRNKNSTKKNKLSTLALLSQFNPQTKFKDITSHFVYDFETYLYSKGFHANTIAKHMKHLRTFVNSAINKEHIASYDYAFQRYKIKTYSGKHIFLLPEELFKLEKLELPPSQISLQHTLDAFLFCCYTGLRYSDFKNLTQNNITIIEGKPWVILHTIKTGAEVKLPISLLFDGKAWDILKKHHQCIDSFFKLKSNSKVNKDLVRIGELAKINKHFSFHTARHTNATLLIYKGVNITTVQKLLGHRNVLTTQIYSEVMNRTIINDLENSLSHKHTSVKDEG